MKKITWMYFFVVFCFISSTTIAQDNSITSKGNLPQSNHSNVNINGELKKWHKVTLNFDGPAVSENDNYNPFMNYRFN